MTRVCTPLGPCRSASAPRRSREESEMPTRADIIRTRQAAIRADLDALEQVEEPAEEHHTRSDALLKNGDELVEELAPLEEREQKIAAVRAAMAEPANRELAVPEQPSSPEFRTH